jgi:hypothetical protein
MANTKLRLKSLGVVCLIATVGMVLTIPGMGVAPPHPYPWHWVPPYYGTTYLPAPIIQLSGIQAGVTQYYQTFSLSTGQAHQKDYAYALYVASASIRKDAGLWVGGPPGAISTSITVYFTWHLNSAAMTTTLTQNLGVGATSHISLTLMGFLKDKATGQVLTAPGYLWVDHGEVAPRTNWVWSVSNWDYVYAMHVTNAILNHGYDVYGYLEMYTSAWAGVGTTAYVTNECYATLTDINLQFA